MTRSRLSSLPALAVLVQRLGRLAEARMREICDALAVAVDCGG